MDAGAGKSGALKGDGKTTMNKQIVSMAVAGALIAASAVAGEVVSQNIVGGPVGKPGPMTVAGELADVRRITMNWQTGKTYHLDSIKVTVSKPNCVGRDDKEFWYPNLMRFADGTLAMSIRTGDDRLTEDDAVLVWSKDNGLTWTEPKPYHAQSFCYLELPSGEFALLPHHMYRAEDGCKGSITVIDKKGTIRLLKDGVRVTGWPRDVLLGDLGNPKDAVAAVEAQGHVYCLFNGTPFRLQDGTFLSGMYCNFVGAKRDSNVVLESRDGLNWRVRAVIADENCRLRGAEGPCELCLLMLPDKRLMCVFRRGWETYGQCWSTDEGRTWSEPVAMATGIGKVEPKLLALQNGTIVLAGGRPRLYAWFNLDQKGERWLPLDMTQHHNDLLPEVPVTDGIQNDGGTSSYTGIVEIEPDTFLYVYDRVPDSYRVITHWKTRPEYKDNIRERFSIYIARVTIERR
jgi:hypothetical protein